MTSRSLKFRLVVWYAGLLSCCFLVLGAASYAALQGYLVAALKGSLSRRARQVAELVVEREQRGEGALVGSDVDTRYTPQLNDRFVRITRSDGTMLYRSRPPANESFRPDLLPASPWPGHSESSQRVALSNRRQMLVVARVISTPSGAQFLVESGAPMDDVQDDLRQWLLFLGCGFPVVMLVAVSSGYLLVKRALTPVDQIAASAERISSHNLSERLPVARSGDELERLSIALNHMIARLDQAFQHSRQFAADASHELRTPMTVLRGELETAAQDPKLSPEWRERFGSALEEVERLVNIVEGLFAISRLDAGEAQKEWVPFDLGRLTMATADQMALLAEDKEIKVNCTAADNVWVEGDRARMKQVVVNLLDNAIKYTPPKGAVSLTVTARNGRAMLDVADNGMGIPAEALPHVFERFFRVDKARSREMGGAGLGLSIVRSICVAHHGKVEALSTPGQGSVFHVELPLATSPQLNGKQNSHEH